MAAYSAIEVKATERQSESDFPRERDWMNWMNQIKKKREENNKQSESIQVQVTKISYSAINLCRFPATASHTTESENDNVEIDWPTELGDR